MSEHFNIDSGNGRLAFSLPLGDDKVGDYLLVTFSGEGLSASTRVYDAAGQMLGIPRLFQDLATNWKGGLVPNPGAQSKAICVSAVPLMAKAMY